MVFQLLVNLVEKAAAVFSLKLDNGHKLLCPWIDNACDEALTLFPPSPPHALLESYRERSLALLKLSALPVISSSAINYMKMKSPQLENFLSESSDYPINLSKGIKIVDSSICKDMDGGYGTVTADLFYQVCFLVQFPLRLKLRASYSAIVLFICYMSDSCSSRTLKLLFSFTNFA